MKEELARKWTVEGISPRVIDAFFSVRRETFVPEEFVSDSYVDSPLPIGFGQTISQPTTVIIMINALELQKDDVVLEIGSGSGYNAAVMAKLCKKVYSVEYVKQLASLAQKNLEKEGIKNAEIIHADGSNGYPKHAPYDRIISTAAVPEIPEKWMEQLKIGGIIVAPVGPLSAQEMIKITKLKNGLKIKNLGAFRFVPLRGESGYNI